jgi:3-oxoacyl-[acyl-carrier protein] reductase
MSDSIRAAPARIAVVTGASRGIGRAIALNLARPTGDQPGRHIVLVSRSPGPLAEVKAEIERAGGRASVRVVDVADSTALAGALDAAAEEHGRLDILVNNAGMTRDGLLLRMSDDDWDQVLRINLTSAFVAIRAAARPMIRHRFGRIVNIGSTTGVVGNAGQANYAAAKAGLTGLTKTVARELGGKGITCNCVCPGFVETDMTVGLPQQIKDGILGVMPVKRLGAPDDIAAAVAYVTSDAAGFLTGQTICVDGGLTMN